MLTKMAAAAWAAGLVFAAAASAAPRTLEVPATAAWQHAATGMVLPSKPAGFGRTSLADSTAEELDVHAQYEAPGEGTRATVYLYKTGVPDVALWFDRAVAAILGTPGYGVDRATVPAPAGFARPGETQSSGLSTVLPATGLGLRSTGVAVVGLGEWLIKLRMSSSSLDPAALSVRMNAFLAGLRWPAATGAGAPPRPIAACAAPLAAKRAKVIRPEMANVLIDLVTADMVADKAKGPAPVYCRDPAALGPHGVYRPDGSKRSYLIALNDAGIALSVAPAISIDELGSGGGKRWSMTLLGRDTRSALPSFNRLPPPDQALKVWLGGGGPGVSVSTDKGNDTR